MTPQEIMKASLLDIVFEKRNKEYGAYPLRRDYNNRLLISVLAGISTIFLIYFIIPQPQEENVASDHIPPVVLKIFELEPEIPKPEVKLVPSQSPQAATRQFTSRIEMVPDNITINMPPVAQLANELISTTTQTGTPGMPQGPLPDPTPVATDAQVPPTEPQGITAPPQFPGGNSAWLSFLTRHLQVPSELEAGEKKTVQVQFIVDTDGVVTGFRVIQSAGKIYDEEVIRVLKKMPRWKPALQNGTAVSSSFMQPVTFQGFEE